MKAKTLYSKLSDIRCASSFDGLDTDIVVRVDGITYHIDKLVARKDGTLVIRTRRERSWTRKNNWYSPKEKI